MKRPGLWFFLLLLLLASWHTDRWNTNDNTTSRALPVLTMTESGTWQIDKYHEKTKDKSRVGDHYYTDKAPLPSLLVLPVFYGLHVSGIIPERDGSLYGSAVYLLGNLLCGSIPFALIIFLAWRYAVHKGADPFRSGILAVLGFFGSFLFVYSGTFFAHLLSGLFFFLSLLKLKEKSFLVSGLFLGLSFLCEYTILMVAPLWVLQWLFQREWKGILRFSLGLAGPLVFIGTYNFLITGNAFTMLYKFHTFTEVHSSYGFSLPDPAALWGLTFSTQRGLFIYAPLLLIFLVSLFSGRSPGFRAFLIDPVYPVIIFFILVMSGYYFWQGGWACGPRLLIPAAIVLLAEAIPKLSAQKWFYPSVILGSVGVILALAAKSTLAYSLPTDEVNPFGTMILPAFFKGEFNDCSWLSMTGISAWISLAAFSLVFLLTVFGLKKIFRTS